MQEIKLQDQQKQEQIQKEQEQQKELEEIRELERKIEELKKALEAKERKEALEKQFKVDKKKDEANLNDKNEKRRGRKHRTNLLKPEASDGQNINANSDLSDRTNASKPSRLSEEETNKAAAGKVELMENSPGAGSNNALLNIVISGNEGAGDKELEEFKKIENSLSIPSTNAPE